MTLNYNVLGLVNRAPMLGNVTDFSYTRFGEVATQTQWSSQATALQTRYTYDAMGRTTVVSTAVWSRNADNQVRYDAFGRPSRRGMHGALSDQVYDVAPDHHCQRCLGAQSWMSYDAFGNVLSQTDRSGNTTTYHYTAFNREVRMTTAEGIQTVSRRNEHGQVVDVVDGRGNSTTYQYDRDGQLTRTTTPAGSSSASYDRAVS